jgi:hypothetical protein
VFVVAVDRAYAAHRRTDQLLPSLSRTVIGVVRLTAAPLLTIGACVPLILPCGAARNAQMGKRHSLRPVSLWIGDSESSREFPRPNTVESRCTLPLVYGGSQVSNSGSVGPRNSSRRLRFLLPARAHSRRCVANYVYCEALRQKFSPARNKRGR